jgi:leucyl/phenylalanyl-tRNA--protein transferase
VGQTGVVSRVIEPPVSKWRFPSSAAEVNAAVNRVGHRHRNQPWRTGDAKVDDDPASDEARGGGRRREPDGDGEIVGVGADLEPGTLLAAYRSGLFPMPAGRQKVAWWSPNPRGILPLDALRVSRSLRKSSARFEVTIDRAFERVIEGCADRGRQGAWISDEVEQAYFDLHRLGWVHSVETWDQDGNLAGGLYGVAISGLFAGESMFHRADDASKVALMALVSLLRTVGSTLLDVQWQTPHLTTLGAVAVSRSRYHRLLGEALGLPQPSFPEPGSRLWPLPGGPGPDRDHH